MKYCKLHIVCLLTFLFLGLFSPAFSQCKNAIAIKKVSNEANVKNSGALDIKVTSEGKFVCILNIEKGSGPVKIQKQEGHGNSVIHFKGLDTTQMYQVQVEFLSEETTFCKKLQKSQITFDAE